MTGLGNRVHIFAHPETPDRVTWFFTAILGCDEAGTSRTVHLPPNIQLFRFPDGAAMTIEFTEDALTMKDARRSAYLEVRIDDPAALQRQVLDAGLPEVDYPGTGYFYFQAPTARSGASSPTPRHAEGP